MSLYICSRNKSLFSVDRHQFPLKAARAMILIHFHFLSLNKGNPVFVFFSSFSVSFISFWICTCAFCYFIFGILEIHLSAFKMNAYITRVEHACRFIWACKMLCSTLNKKTLNNVWTIANGNTNDASMISPRKEKEIKQHETKRNEMIRGSTMNFVYNPKRCRRRQRQRQ